MRRGPINRSVKIEYRHGILRALGKLGNLVLAFMRNSYFTYSAKQFIRTKQKAARRPNVDLVCRFDR